MVKQIMHRWTDWLFGSVGGVMMVSSCGPLSQDSGNQPSQRVAAFGQNVPPPIIRTNVIPPTGNHGANTPTNTNRLSAMLTPEEDIVFTNPDNPDDTLPELSTILTESVKSKTTWGDSFAASRKAAAREGKPLLLWFTDSSARSPLCKVLSNELLATSEFEKWAQENVIRLKLDINADVHDPNLSLDQEQTRSIELKRSMQLLKNRYKVLGYPTLVLLNPNGQMIGHYRGFKQGQADFTWGQLRQGVAASLSSYADWRKSMEQKGYREWSDGRGRMIFAKLANYSKGVLTLIEPDGSRARTHENQLSNQDRAWIGQQKSLRGLR